jgi:hypothetical protein
MSDRRTMRHLNIAVGLAVACAVAAVAFAAFAPTPPPIVHTTSDAITCPAGQHVETWLGFDTSYQLATCYHDDRDEVVIEHGERTELACKLPEFVVVDPDATNARCGLS